MEQIVKEGLLHKPISTAYIICRDTDSALQLIREALLAGEILEVINDYESFYGVEFDGWLREGISDIPCEIKTGRPLNWTSFPHDYLITPINK